MQFNMGACAASVVLLFSTSQLIAQVAPAPFINNQGIVSTASYAPGSNALAPGSLAAIT